jgi:hypothetical protein
MVPAPGPYRAVKAAGQHLPELGDHVWPFSRNLSAVFHCLSPAEEIITADNIVHNHFGRLPYPASRQGVAFQTTILFLKAARQA